MTKAHYNVMDKALEIAVKAHTGKVDCNGEPSVLHPLAVGMMGETDEEKITGFLVDILDFPGITCEELLSEGIPAGTVNALKVLYCGDPERIVASRNPVALMVKEHDLIVKHDDSGALGVIREAIKEQSRVRAYSKPSGKAVAIFACGCFWGVQHQFSREPGVTAAHAGYTGGREANPSYADVRAHRTGHVEAVAVEYDTAQTDYRQLCHLFKGRETKCVKCSSVRVRVKC